ncbi:MAG: response regulator [Phycisphaeraceae bacterium]|nr:MAG: response regulator [Phycisphaeraceae bacterium]
MASRVLVCDDEFHIRSVLASALRRAGYEVVESRDGVEGGELAVACRPDAIVTDLQMPRGSGLELCQKLSGDPSFARVPIVLLSARSHLVEESAMLAVGIRRVVRKPFSAREVVSIVDELLRGASGVAA